MVGFGYGGSLVIHNQMQVGTMLLVYFAVAYAAFGVGQFAQMTPDFAKARAAATEIFRTIDSKPIIPLDDPNALTLSRMDGRVTFKGVDFTYPARPEIKVLQGLNLECPAGKTTALVGSSGCGKSTVIQLIERFYDPQAGVVAIDDVAISEVNLRWLREHVGLVAQEPLLFATTIEENIRYGKLDATMEEIEEAAKRANAYDFIMGLPNQFRTEVGEKGTQLSGGQKQRIAIARAILKNPRLLLLDEATSALDTESEAVVQDALDRLMIGRTSIVIAHRLTTIQNADLIHVMHSGQVLESGTHAELLERQGHYHQLVNRQF